MEGAIPGYRITKEIAKGGMASVYIAVQENFDRQVALKIMAQHLTGDPVFGERFIREAKIVARLNHRNIVPVFDVGSFEQHHYLAMEYLPGGDLKARLRSGIAPEDALFALFEVANALAYAHSKNYVHRDIKPENILFREDNTVVLTDFGIAKAIDTTDCNMTSTGMVVGSPHYMSPEQALAKPIDHRTDIYSLGIVLYELLTGLPMYDAGSSVAAAIKHVSEPIPKLPEPFECLQPILEKMAAKSPDDRYQSAAEVSIALEPYLQAPSLHWNTISQQEETETSGGTKIMYRPGLISRSGQYAAVSRTTPVPGTVTVKSATQPGSEPAPQPDQESRSNDVLSPALAWIRGTSLTSRLAAGAGVSVLALGLVLTLHNSPPVQAKSSPEIAKPAVAKTTPPKVKPKPVVATHPAPATPHPAAVAENTQANTPPAQHPNSTVAQESPPAPASTQIAKAALAPDGLFTSAAKRPEVMTQVEDVKDSTTGTNTADTSAPKAQFAATTAVGKPATDPQASTIENADTAVKNSAPQTASNETPDTATTVAMADSAVPTQDSPDTAKIEQLLAQGDQALRHEYLTSPKGKSAYDNYRAVLKLQPDNAKAIQGIEAIIEHYRDLASKQLNGGDLNAAQTYVEHAESIASNYPVASSLHNEINQLLQTVKRISDLETMKKFEQWNALLKTTKTPTIDQLNQAYTIYMEALNIQMGKDKVDAARQLYAKTFFRIGKRHFKDDDMKGSKDLIAKGLEIDPQNSDLKDLDAHWKRRANGKEGFFDRFW